MITDLRGEELRRYRSDVEYPHDFDSFWSDTLAEARSYDIQVNATPAPSPLETIDVWDVSFRGFGGQEVRGWYRRPRDRAHDLPVVVEFVGYGGGRGLPEDSLFWASCGFAHFQMDTRGQGATWSVGVTADIASAGPHVPGMMTSGIGAPEDYYFRRLITDAVRALDAVKALPGTDRNRTVALGTSQGGGLALAVAALSDDVAFLVSYVPFLCDFPRAISITDADPYKEIGRYLAVHRGAETTVLRTLSYFDGVNFAKRATAPAYFTTSLMDPVCPPSTVLAAFNNYGGTKEIQVWGYNGHEGGGREDDVRVAARLRTMWS